MSRKEIIQIIPASGWNMVFDNGPGRPYQVIPITMWALYKIYTEGRLYEDEKVETKIAGVYPIEGRAFIMDGSFFLDCGNQKETGFVGYMRDGGDPEIIFPGEKIER